MKNISLRLSNVVGTFTAAGLVMLFSGSASLAAGTSDTISKSFAVEPGGKLVLDADRGSIEVAAADQDKVDIVVTREVTRASEAEAEAILKDHDVTMSQEGNQVRVTAKSSKPLRGSWFRPQPNLRVHFQITVPRKFDVNTKTAGGSIKVAGLEGNVEVATAGGSLSLSKIHGAMNGRTSGGSISVADCVGELKIKTSGGSIRVENLEGNVDAGTSGGSLRFTKIDGAVNGRTSGGSVRVSDCTGELDVKTSGGSIDIKDFTGPSVQAKTSGGSVSADLASVPKSDCSLSTSAGSITVKLPETSALNLDAHTSAGKVSTDLPVTTQGKLEGNALSGTINGGGPLLSLKTSAGSIHIVKR